MIHQKTMTLGTDPQTERPVTVSPGAGRERGLFDARPQDEGTTS